MLHTEVPICEPASLHMNAFVLLLKLLKFTYADLDL